jgi:pimeloyl-ACP methyl ester carboxylesterase
MPRRPQPTALMEPPVPAGASQPSGLPVFVLSGEFDHITTAREPRQVAHRYPSSRLRIVRNRGHASDLYYPHRSLAVRWIRRFVADH